MKLAEVTLYENKSHRILKEGWQDLTESQQNLQLRFERELFLQVLLCLVKMRSDACGIECT